MAKRHLRIVRDEDVEAAFEAFRERYPDWLFRHYEDNVKCEIRRRFNIYPPRLRIVREGDER